MRASYALGRLRGQPGLKPWDWRCDNPQRPASHHRFNAHDNQGGGEDGDAQKGSCLALRVQASFLTSGGARNRRESPPRLGHSVGTPWVQRGVPWEPGLMM